jgi:hypothetical protein
MRGFLDQSSINKHMRFKDFEIVIHGDFESGDDELDLRSAIAKKLGGLSAKTSDAEAETVQKIEDGDARWAPPLQQHLDVLKQSLANTSDKTETSSQILELDSAKKYYDKYHESISRSGQLIEAVQTDLTFCKSCGKLMLGQQLTESLSDQSLSRITKAWNKLLEHYRVPKKKCNCDS